MSLIIVVIVIMVPIQSAFVVNDSPLFN